MGVSTATTEFGSIRRLEERLGDERRRANSWRIVAWVAMFFLALAIVASIP